MRIVFLLLLLIHGLIHLMGFARGFELAEIKELTLPVSRLQGMLWLIACLLLLSTAGLFLAKFPMWWMAGLAGGLLSQALIFMNWSDARFGTLANILLIFVAVVALAGWNFERKFHRDVVARIARTNALPEDTLRPSDLKQLPPVVQEYIQYSVGSGQPKVRNFFVRFKGRMRGRDQDWFDFTSEQYNFLDQKERLFFMKARIKGIPVWGYHSFKDGQAVMDIRLLSLIPVARHSGPEMTLSETVTLFNDMCLMAPSSLADPAIEWLDSDSLSATARFQAGGHEIQAQVLFNPEGQLKDFRSDDRYDMAEKQQYPFSTPASEYREFSGRMLPGFGQAVWHYPEGPFTYGEFRLQEVRYNVTDLGKKLN